MMRMPVRRFLFILLFVTSANAQMYNLGVSSVASDWVVLGDRAYYVGMSPNVNIQLWSTDGTRAGTYAITHFAGGQVSSPFVMGQKIYFFYQSFDARTLYETDGTESGTRAIFVVPDSLTNIAATDQLLYFVTKGNRDNPPISLWRSDGTAAGTSVIATMPSGSLVYGTAVGRLAYLTFYFDWRPYAQNYELWRSDGTAAGTFKLATGDGFHPVALGEMAFFLSKGRLWKSDGTLEGTKEFRQNFVSEILLSANGKLFFVENYSSLMKTDGTAAGTSMVTQLVTPLAMVATAQGFAIFTWFSSSDQVGIWKSDGTGAGTTLVKTIPGSYDYQNQSVGDLLFFTMRRGNNSAIWRTDGSEGGTFEVTRESRLGSRSLRNLGGRLLFSAMDDVHGFEPWISDGTSAGTEMIGNFHPESRIEGRVTDARTSAPITDARVLVQSSSGGAFGTLGVDAEGRFSQDGLPAAKYVLSVDDTSRTHLPQTLEPIVVTAGVDVPRLDISLRRGGSISGRVIAANGTPAAGVEVFVARRYNDAPIASAKTRADGTYTTLGPIPPREPFLVYTTDRAGYSGVIYPNVSCASGCNAASEGTRIQLLAGEQRSGLDFTVRPWGRIRGRLLDRITGKPILDPLVVSVFRRNQAYFFGEGSTTARDGEFEVALRDGEYRLRVDGTTDYTATWYPSQPCPETTQYCEQGTIFSPIPGETMRILDTLVEPIGGRIAGRVVDAATGEPLGHTFVRVVDAQDKFVTQTVTDADGFYETRPIIRPGVAHTLHTVVRPPYVAETYDGGNGLPCDVCPRLPAKTISVPADKTPVGGIDFALNRLGTISGVALDAVTGQPLKSVAIQLIRSDRGAPIPSPPIALEPTDASGRFTAELWPGSYTLQGQKDGWRAAAGPTVRADLDTVAETTVPLTPACGPSGAPVSVVLPARGGMARLATNDTCTRCAFSTGSFIHLMSSCPAGSFRYSVKANPSTEPRTATIVLPGETITLTQQGQPAQ
jgi:ELWxxDGT repeat protein